MCCFGDLDKDCYVEYKATTDGPWLASKFCETCVGYLLTSQFQKYKDSLANTKCKAEMRRLVEAGPPVNVFDKNALPCENDTKNGEVAVLWYSSDGQEHSAKLEGSLEGEERAKYWEEIKKFYSAEEPEDEQEQKTA